jgi:hypothetical protein
MKRNKRRITLRSVSEIERAKKLQIPEAFGANKVYLALNLGNTLSMKQTSWRFHNSDYY